MAQERTANEGDVQGAMSRSQGSAPNSLQSTAFWLVYVVLYFASSMVVSAAVRVMVGLLLPESLSLTPWTAWIVQRLVTTVIFGILTAIVKGLYRSAVYDDVDILFARRASFGLIFRIWIAWLMGRPLTFTLFRPLKPAGYTANCNWTTQGGTITLTQSTHTYHYPSLRVINGLARLYGVTYRSTCTRIDDQLCSFHLEPEPATSTFEQAQDLLDNQDEKDFVIRRETQGDKIYTYVARCGMYETVKVDSRCWETILNCQSVVGKETTSYSVGTQLDKFVDVGKDEQLLMQSLLAACWNSRRIARLPVQRPAHKCTIQFVGDTRDDPLAPFKPTGRTTLPPLATKPNTSPTKGRQSDLSAVHYRIDMVRNTVGGFTEQARKYIDEFVHLVAPEAIRPWTIEAVVEHQDGPLQKIRNAKAMHTMIDLWAKVKAMVKVEPISNNGPVRNISTLPAEFNLANGRYMLAAAEWMKANTKWYTAGKTPTAIARRMVELAAQAMKNAPYPRAAQLCCADVSKMDAGKHPYLQAWLSTRIYARMFTQDQEELFHIREQEAGSTAVTDTGLPYEVGASQLSGSACTTIDNTITNAFLSYAAHRLEGKSPTEAYDSLGAYVGDDSVSHNTAQSMEAAGQLYGYTIKAEMLSYGEHVPFLSRYFYALWHGEAYSLQDPNRLMAKAHLSYSPPNFTDLEAATNKFRGYSELDPGVRVYAHIYEKLKEVGGDTGRSWSGDLPYNLVAGEGWPSSGEAQDIWTGMTGVTVGAYVRWLGGCHSYDDLLASKPPLVLNDGKDKPTLSLDPAEPASMSPASGSVPAFATVEVAQDHPGVEAARCRKEEAVAETRRVQKAEKVEKSEKIRESKIKLAHEKKAKKKDKPPSLLIGMWNGPPKGSPGGV